MTAAIRLSLDSVLPHIFHHTPRLVRLTAFAGGSRHAKKPLKRAYGIHSINRIPFHIVRKSASTAALFFSSASNMIWGRFSSMPLPLFKNFFLIIPYLHHTIQPESLQVRSKAAIPLSAKGDFAQVLQNSGTVLEPIQNHRT